MPTNISGLTGIDQVQDNTVTTADIQNGAVTSAKLDTLVQPVGVGQTWQNVTAQRVAGTTYTNNTGRPISVLVTVNTTGAAAANLVMIVSGVTISAIGQSQNPAVSLSQFVIVPAGATYSASLSAANLSSWFELRT